MRNKKLPRYEVLRVIFGKERAQGKRAKDAFEMENEAIEEQEYDNDFDEAIDPSVQVEEVLSVHSKKKKNMGHANPFLKSFNDAVLFFGERLKELQTSIC